MNTTTKPGNLPGVDDLRAAGLSEAEIVAKLIRERACGTVRRWCGGVEIRLRFTGQDGHGRYEYAGAVSFPDGRRWPFRALCPPPGTRRDGDHFPGNSPYHFDVAAAQALSWCGWMSSEDGDGYHNYRLSDAVCAYADYISPDNGENRWRIAYKRDGRCVRIIAA